MSARVLEPPILSPAFAGRDIDRSRNLAAGAATDDLQPYHPAIDKYVLVEIKLVRMVVGAPPTCWRPGTPLLAADHVAASNSLRLGRVSTWPCSTTPRGYRRSSPNTASRSPCSISVFRGTTTWARTRRQPDAMFNVCRRDGDTIRHFRGSEKRYAPTDPGKDSRDVDSVDALWHLFDFAPEGRG